MDIIIRQRRKTPKTSMYFHVCKKDFPASFGKHKFMILMTFESEMNKAINEGYLTKFQHCIFHVLQFKVLGNFEKATFPLTSMMTLPKKCPKKKQVCF